MRGARLGGRAQIAAGKTHVARRHAQRQDATQRRDVASGEEGGGAEPPPVGD